MTQGNHLRLRDVPFSDLLLSLDGVSKLMKGNGIGNATRPVEDGLWDECGVLLNQVYSMSEQRLKQGKSDTDFIIGHDGVSYRVARIASINGIWFSLRRNMYSPNDIGSLNIDPINTKMMRTSGAGGSGLTLIIGEMNNGKTTTASALFRDWVVTNGGVGVTVENPPELPIAGHFSNGVIFQVEEDEKNFGNAIHDLKRWGANFIYVGEIREKNAANELINVGMSGVSTISTIHGGSIQQGLASLIRLADREAQAQVAKNLSMILKCAVFQTLVQVGDKRIPKVQSLYVNKDNQIQVANAIERQDWAKLRECIEAQEKFLKSEYQALLDSRKAGSNMPAPANMR